MQKGVPETEMKKHRHYIKDKWRTLVEETNKVLESPVLLQFDFITLLFMYDFEVKFIK
jgi:hypothetical protein